MVQTFLSLDAANVFAATKPNSGLSAIEYARELELGEIVRILAEKMDAHFSPPHRVFDKSNSISCEPTRIPDDSELMRINLNRSFGGVDELHSY